MTNENSKFYIKARIVPHGKHNSMKYVLKSDAKCCSRILIPVVCSIPAIIVRPFSKLDLTLNFYKVAQIQDTYTFAELRALDTKSSFNFFLLLLFTD